MWLQSYCWCKKLCHLLGDAPGLRGRLFWIHRAVRLFSFSSTKASQTLASFSEGGSQVSLSSRLTSGERDRLNISGSLQRRRMRGRVVSRTARADFDFFSFIRLAELSVFTAVEVILAERPEESKTLKLTGFSGRVFLMWKGWIMLSAL